MSDVMITIFGGALAVLATAYGMFVVARARSDRRRQERLSIAFDRAKSIRTRGVGFPGGDYSVYVDLDPSDRR